MKTILHLLSSNKLSGAENVAIDIIRNLDNSYKAYYLSPEGPIRQILNDDQICYVPVDRMGLLAVRKVVNQLKPDIIHAHDYRASVIGALVKGKAKLISHLHNNYTGAQKYNAKTCLYSSVMGRIDKIVVVSNSVLEEHVCYKKMLPKTVVLQNCIDVKKIYNVQGVKDDRNIDVIFVGRLTEHKDPLTFITCIYKLLNKGLEVKAVMIGEGELKSSCITEIQRLGLLNHIIMYGFQRNPYKYMSDSRVLLIPSKWEGFGLVAMEAMSLGVPVICTGVGGLKEIVSNGENGFVCNGIDEMLNAIEDLLLDNYKWHLMSKNAQATAANRNNIKNYIEKIKRLYN